MKLHGGSEIRGTVGGSLLGGLGFRVSGLRAPYVRKLPHGPVVWALNSNVTPLLQLGVSFRGPLFS